MPTVALFIDGESFSIQCRRAYSAAPDYLALARLVARRWHHTLGPIYYYASPAAHAAAAARQQRFWAAQEAKGITLRFGRRAPNPDGGYRQKEVDVMIACDLLAAAYERSCDRAALVSGDTDFAYAIERAAGQGLDVGWVHLPSQQHLERLRDVVPPHLQLVIDAKTFRTIGQQPPVRYPHRVRSR